VATAARYFAAARTCFRDSDWQSRPALSFDLFLQSAECALQTRQFRVALELLDAIRHRPLGRVAAAQVAAKRIHVHTRMQPPEQTLPLVLDTLAQFGVHWPSDPGWLRVRWEILRTDWALRGPLDEHAFQPLGGGDHSRLIAKLMLMTAGGATLAVCGSQAVLSVSFALRACRRHGYAAPPGHLLAGYNALRHRVLGGACGSERYAQAALEWSARAPDPVLTPRAEYLLHAFHYAWTRPRRSALEPLRLVAERLLEVGDVEYAQYSRFMRSIHGVLAGESLDDLQAAFQEREGGGELVSHRQLHCALELLRAAPGDAVALDAEMTAIERTLEDTAGGRMGGWLVWMLVLSVLGRFERAFGVAADPRRFSSGGGDVAFYRGLAAAALAADPRSADRRRLRGVLRRCAQELDRWSKWGPDFEHMARGLRAEQARLRGRAREALALYTQAAERAMKQGFRHHAALLQERKAGLLVLQRRGTEAAVALRLATALYAQWGAVAKAAALRAGGV
jgi:hypothetical protein